MLLRSITEHVRTQNWSAIWIDLVIVVVGVFLGIQVSNWNDARLESRRGEYFSARLREDIEREFGALDFIHDYYSIVYDYGRTAIGLFDAGDPAQDNRFVVSAYNASQFITANPIRATFDELIATGGLQLLRDPRLRNGALFLYNAGARRRLSDYVLDSAFRERVRRVLPYDVQEAIRAQCGDRTDGLLGYLRLPPACEIEFDQARISAAASLLRSDEQARADLAFFLSTLGYLVADIKSVRKQTELLLWAPDPT